MDVYLIRHAHAGDRGHGVHDKWRPLSERGRERSVELVSLLEGINIGAVVSSSATRCVQTVEPLAAELGLEVIETEDLWEEATADEALQLLLEYAGSGAAMSSHGNIIPELIETLARQGVPITGRGCEKGSVWVVSHDGDHFTGARYISRQATTLA